MTFEEKTLSREEIYSGRIIKVHKDAVLLQDGKQSVREVVEHMGGVGVLPLDGDGNVTLVRQFRYPFAFETVEIPAGKLEEGEEPMACAVRELSEETGYTAGKYVSLGSILPSPGYCRETIFLFLALDLQEGKQHLDSGEFLDNLKMPLDELCRQVMDGTVTDAKTVAAALKAKCLMADRRTNNG